MEAQIRDGRSPFVADFGAHAVREHGDARSAAASAPKRLPELYVLVTRKEDDINVARQA